MKTLEQKYVEKQAINILEEKGQTELQFLRDAAPNLIKWLMQQPADYWKNYGMYWFNLAEVLRNHDPKGWRAFLEYIGGEDSLNEDEDVKKEFDYGSDIYNWTAAAMYLDSRIDQYKEGADNPHDYFDDNEEARPYDPSVGFIGEQNDVQSEKEGIV